MLFGRGGGKRRKRRRSAWPFFTHIINTMPPPVPALGASGSGLSDIADLIARLGGNAAVSAFYDIRANVASTGGVVSTWSDARGAGFGPVLTAAGSPTITGAGLSQLINTNGSTSWLQSALSALFDLSQPITLFVGCTLPDISKILAGIAPTSNVPGMQMFPGAGNFKGFYEPSANTLPCGGTTSGPSGAGVRTMDGRLYCMAISVNGTAAQVQAWPATVATTTLSSGASSGSCALSLGTDPGHADPVAASYRFGIVLARAFSQSDAQMVTQWAVANHGVFNDHPSAMFCHGDSLSIGFNLTDLTNNYPTQLNANAPFAAGWANVNEGVAGQSMAQMVTSALTVVDPFYSPGRTENIVVVWGGTNDLAASVPPATVFANLQTYVNARRAVGWKVAILTCIDRTGINETNRATYNASITSTYGGGAVPGVAVADVAGNASIGANGAASNATFFMADGIHLQTAGYAIVAPLVATAITSIL